MLSESDGNKHTSHVTEILVVLGLALASAIAIKVPEIFGISISAGNAGFYGRNISLMILPFLSGYFAWKRKLSFVQICWLTLTFAIVTGLASIYPFISAGATELLAALYLPIALWLPVGFAYMGGRWRSSSERMGFVRFSGELFVYYVLIALGGGVFVIFTGFIFEVIGLNLETIVGSWLIPCGAVGAGIVGAWLVEMKQGVIENIAPILARLFTPMFTAMLIVFLTSIISQYSKKTTIYLFLILTTSAPIPSAFMILGLSASGKRPIATPVR